jgi:Bcr/CflA subfamily drug resistance transporter
MQHRLPVSQRPSTPFLFLGALSAFSILTFDLYQPALPAITAYFNTTHILGQLTLSLFFFVFGLAQLVWGPLIDHFGRRVTLRLSLLLFFIATLGCIFSVNIEMLILSRIIQGFAVCCAHIIAFSSARDQDDSTDRARVLSHISMSVSVSPILGPLVGSLILLYYGWQATFILMAVLSLLFLLLAEIILKESPYWSQTKNSFLWRVSLANYKKILPHKRLWIGTILVSSSYACIIILIINTAYLLIDNLRLSPLLFSVLFGSNGLILIIGNFIGIKLRERTSLIWNIRAGATLMLISSTLMLTLFYQIGLSLITLAPILALTLGISLLNPPTFSLVLTDYKKHAGTATAILNTVRMTLSAIMGGIMGVLIVYNASFLAMGLLLCSLVCFVFSFVIWED